jgi:sigma-E factor negative regulatory protein RseC
MKETGRILKIQGKKITVKAGEIGACFGCMNQECKSNERVFTAENTLNLRLAEGDLIEIENPAAASLIQAAAVLAPPLVLAVAAYMAVGWIFPQSQDPARAAASVVGLFAGFLGMYWYRKLVPSPQTPKVVQKLEENPVVNM